MARPCAGAVGPAPVRLPPFRRFCTSPKESFPSETYNAVPVRVLAMLYKKPSAVTARKTPPAAAGASFAKEAEERPVFQSQPSFEKEGASAEAGVFVSPICVGLEKHPSRGFYASSQSFSQFSACHPLYERGLLITPQVNIIFYHDYQGGENIWIIKDIT